MNRIKVVPRLSCSPTMFIINRILMLRLVFRKFEGNAKGKTGRKMESEKTWRKIKIYMKLKT